MAKKKIMCSSECVVSGAGIELVKIEELHDFKEHPFKVERNQALFELRRSIEQEGVLIPLEEEQYELHAVMELEQCVPNISQANRLKRMSQQKLLDMDRIYEILQEIKPNQREQIKIPMERLGRYFPANYTPAQQVELIEQLLKVWAKNHVK